MANYWLSFCDPEQPKGDQFLGVILAESDEGLASVVMETHRRGVNPGGEIQVMEFNDADVPPDALADFKTAPKMTLLSVQELRDLGLEPTQE